MAITSYDDIINGRANGGADDVYFAKTTAVGGVTTSWYGYMLIDGNPVALSPPSIQFDGWFCTSATVGAIPLRACNPVSHDKALLTFGAKVSNAQMANLMLVDILWCASISAATSAVQSVTTAATVSRYSDGYGNMLLAIVKSALSSGTPTITVQYVDDAGNTVNSIATATVASAAANRVVIASVNTPFLPLNAASRGVKSVVSATMSAANGAAAQCLLMIVHPIMMLPTIAVSTYVERDSTIQIDGIIDLQAEHTNGYSACLGILGYTTGVNTSTIEGMIRTVEN